MENEKLLTLEEIAKIIETATEGEWNRIYDSYYGKTEFINIHTWKGGFFPWSKIWGISISGKYSDEEGYIELSSITGEEVYPLYKRIQGLYDTYYEKKEQERIQKRNEKLREIRGR